MCNSNDSTNYIRRKYYLFTLGARGLQTHHCAKKPFGTNLKLEFESHALLHGNFMMDEESPNIIHRGAVLSTWMGSVEYSATK